MLDPGELAAKHRRVFAGGLTGEPAADEDVYTDLRPEAARDLAFRLLECAEQAEQVTEHAGWWHGDPDAARGMIRQSRPLLSDSGSVGREPCSDTETGISGLMPSVLQRAESGDAAQRAARGTDVLSGVAYPRQPTIAAALGMRLGSATPRTRK